MKPGVSSLNPYAASYIPLSQRGSGSHSTVKDMKIGNEGAWCEPSLYNTNMGNEDAWYELEQKQGKASVDPATHVTKKLTVPENFNQTSHYSHGSLMQNPGEAIDTQITDEESEMDLYYLQTRFPGLSIQSILSAYLANNGDLEATDYMLHQLEGSPVETTENLPDTLDIGDVSESGTSATCATLKVKNVSGEASASSSGSTGATIIS